MVVLLPFEGSLSIRAISSPYIREFLAKTSVMIMFFLWTKLYFSYKVTVRDRSWGVKKKQEPGCFRGECLGQAFISKKGLGHGKKGRGPILVDKFLENLFCLLRLTL